jgi:hypothetical protein
VKQSGLNEQDFWEEKVNESIVEIIGRGLSTEEAVAKALSYTVNKELNEVMSARFHKTGEWLIIARKEHVNYYLCLAFHKQPEQDILAKIVPCIEEFPLLKDQIAGSR